MRSLILRSHQCPGDILMLTAAVRDLHAAHPGKFLTDVRTSADALWENNPHITKLKEGKNVETLDMHYPLIHQSNERPYHFLHGYVQDLEQKLDLRIPLTRFSGDVHLTHDEKTHPPLNGNSPTERFWILIAGGKYDFTAKWWNPASYQQVVDHFRGRIQFVQCGEAGHWHPPLENVTNLVGKTTLREFVRLMHFADGVVCPVTFAMHLAAAVESRLGRQWQRPCVVIGGGREPTHWEAYPSHQYISMVGALSCCSRGGCWKSRCQLVGDGDDKDVRNVCEQPVEIRPNLQIPRCMEMIRPEDVIRRIEFYLEGGALADEIPQAIARDRTVPRAPQLIPKPSPSRKVLRTPAGTLQNKPPHRLLIEFRHGLGDSAQLTIVLRHLKHYHPDWTIDLAALHGKHSVGRGLCDSVFVLGERRVAKYDQVLSLSWDECHESYANCPSTKPTRCLKDVFRLTPLPELYTYQIARRPQADQRARDYLGKLCPNGPRSDGRFPVVLLHYQGNTSRERKDLPHEIARQICAAVREQGHVPVVLDWDNRCPFVDQQTIFNPSASDALWGGHGTGDAEPLASLIEASSLMIGVDSGPLHVAGATTTPTIGVWLRHHPVHYFDLCPNVRHLVPEDFRTIAKAPAAAAYFDGHYQFDVYRDLATDLVAQVRAQLGGEPVPAVPIPLAANVPVATPAAVDRPEGRTLTSVVYDRQYYEEHQRTGLDYLSHGDWQRDYGNWFVEALRLKRHRLLDVGCACGSIVRGLAEADAVVAGFDLSEYMINLGRTTWPGMAPLLYVADAADLSCFANSSWDALHSNQVAEHWIPEQVPKILRELARVTSPGGIFFCALDTEEMMVRQRRNALDEDPTHLCIRPRSWWLQQFADAGWYDRTAEFEPALRSHPLSFLNRYDWDFFVLRKESAPLPPAPYDLSAYPNIGISAGASLDRRHLFWMYDVLTAGGFQHALEIGCWYGGSSTAFVEAINREKLPRATFCDVAFQSEFREVVSHCQHPDRIRAYSGRSFDLLRDRSQEFDFVFIDGDHRLQNVREELELLLQRQPVCVVAHDTNAESLKYKECDGPPLLKWAFQTTAPYLCLEDNALRPGEDTARGLFLATKSPEVFEVARQALRRWGAIGNSP